MTGADYVFQAAALKQVPACEFFPWEATQTNVLGTKNVLEVAIETKVKKVVCLSTDKAVYPINAMGITKALMEKIAISKAMESKELSGPVICVTRYGNVMASRGSVIPNFADLIRNGKPITLTNPEMTRFMMTLEDAVELVLFAFQNAGYGDIFVQKSPATTIGQLASALIRFLNKADTKIVNIGERHGEKLHESLLSGEEIARTSDLGKFFKVSPDTRDLNYAAQEKPQGSGLPSGVTREGYSSHTTQQLSESEILSLLDRIVF
jgi:UDP-glucose 4-epimerase